MNSKTAIVTGAARGIGLATTKLFLEEGRRVAMIDRDGEALETAAAGLKGAMPILCDVSIPDQVDAMIETVMAAFGRLDALVNNAGVADFGPIGDTAFDQWRTVMATNLDGVFLCSQAAAPALKERRGAIVNIASISGLRASTLRVAYGTSKAAVMHLTQQQAAELGEFGVRANCVAPGPVNTKLALAVHSPEIRAAYHDGRVGTMDCSIAPLTEPDMRTTHPALWIGPSKCQLKLGRYLRGVKFHPSGFQRYQSSCEPGNRIGPRHARTVGLVPNTPAAIRGTGGSPAARPHCQKMPEKEAGSLLLTHDDSSQPTADMSVEYTQSLDTLFRAEPEVRHPPVEVAAETRHTR